MGAFISIFSSQVKSPQGAEHYEACCQWALLNSRFKIQEVYSPNVKSHQEFALCKCANHYPTVCVYYVIILMRGYTYGGWASRKNNHKFVLCF